MIITRYLILEIVKPLAVVLAILVTLFASYSAAGFLADAVNSLLDTATIAQLIGLKVLIALEVLIPISLYVAVVLAFGRLNGDSELTAMFALRVTPARVLGAVAMLAGGLALLVGTLSILARPWAYQTSHALTHRAESLLNVAAMKAGTFYTGDHGDRVIYLSHRAGPNSPARDVFVRLRRRDHIEIIHARLAFQVKDDPAAGPEVYLEDARIYDIGQGGRDSILQVHGVTVNPNNRILEAVDDSPVATPTLRLMASRTAEDIAELQWRLSTAVSTLLLGLLAVPLSRVQPRQNRYARIGTAILVYSAYYLLCTTARTWVQHGAVPPLPGLWWAPALLGLVLAAALWGPGLRRNGFGRARPAHP